MCAEDGKRRKEERERGRSERGGGVVYGMLMARGGWRGGDGKTETGS